MKSIGVDTLPVPIIVLGKAVKEAIADQIAKELCSSLPQGLPIRFGSPEVASWACHDHFRSRCMTETLVQNLNSL